MGRVSSSCRVNVRRFGSHGPEVENAPSTGAGCAVLLPQRVDKGVSESTHLVGEPTALKRRPDLISITVVPSIKSCLFNGVSSVQMPYEGQHHRWIFDRAWRLLAFSLDSRALPATIARTSVALYERARSTSPWVPSQPLVPILHVRHQASAIVAAWSRTLSPLCSGPIRSSAVSGVTLTFSSGTLTRSGSLVSWRATLPLPQTPKRLTRTTGWTSSTSTRALGGYIRRTCLYRIRHTCVVRIYPS